jgi:hypothetical protein
MEDPHVAEVMEASGRQVSAWHSLD